MNEPNLKLLKKLADSCRKAGIKTFKGFGFEFTLDDLPEPESKKTENNLSAPTKPYSGLNDDPTFPTDSLSEEEMLFWSVPMPNDKQAG